MAKAPRNDKPAETPGEPAPRSGRKGPYRVSGHAAPLARAIAGRNGFPTMTVAARWREIAGEALAAHTQPLSIAKGARGGTLLLRAESGAALLVQHQSREILARVNAILGEGAVTALRLVQGVMPRSRAEPRPAQPRLTQAEEEAIRSQVAQIGDDELRMRLAALLRHAVFAKPRR